MFFRKIALFLFFFICFTAGNLVYGIEIYRGYADMAKKMGNLNKEQKYQMVIDKFERFALEDNKNYVFYNYLGIAYAKVEIAVSNVKKKSNWDKAEKYLLKAYALKEKNQVVMLNLAKLYTWSGDYMKACRFARMYLENNGMDKKTANIILEKYKPNIIEKRVRLEKVDEGKYIFVDK